MARPERYFIGPSLKGKLQDVISRVGDSPIGGGGDSIDTRLQSLARQPRRSRYFRTTEQMPACGSAYGTEVKISSPDCIRVEAVQDAQSVELFDVSNSVRVFNLVKQRGIDLALPVGSIVEAISESQTSSDNLFWRVLQVLSCDCGSGSSSSGSSTSGSSGSSVSSSSKSSSSSGSSTSGSSTSGSSTSGSSTSGSSTSGSSGSGSGCQNIQVVTGVSCVNGSIQVTKTTICAVVQ
jgi:hypothetical protein